MSSFWLYHSEHGVRVRPLFDSFMFICTYTTCLNYYITAKRCGVLVKTYGFQPWVHGSGRHNYYNHSATPHSAGGWIYYVSLAGKHLPGDTPSYDGFVDSPCFFTHSTKWIKRLFVIGRAFSSKMLCFNKSQRQQLCVTLPCSFL